VPTTTIEGAPRGCERDQWVGLPQRSFRWSAAMMPEGLQSLMRRAPSKEPRRQQLRKADFRPSASPNKIYAGSAWRKEAAAPIPQEAQPAATKVASSA
jgi:hypothetical protein